MRWQLRAAEEDEVARMKDATAQLRLCEADAAAAEATLEAVRRSLVAAQEAARRRVEGRAQAERQHARLVCPVLMPC